MTPARQRRIGIALALAIIGAWSALHIYAVFFHPLNTFGLLTAPLLVAGLCWLSVGLFIVAHDCMHGSLAPGQPMVNRAVGRFALLIYAGFWFDHLQPKHFEHHRAPGTATDPDFSEAHPTRFWPWYAAFFRQYFGLRQLAFLSAVSAVYLLLFDVRYANLLLFWALPSIASSLQLFLFGTFLPHRAEEAGFDDQHRARSNNFSWLGSLLSCFHFGYHHEHHLAPHVPWWRLPEARRASLQ